MNKYNSIIILDWDDTLFPTTWTVQKNIYVNDHNKYIIIFSQLDNILHTFLTKCLINSTVVIVTNATIKWIKKSLNLLPYTKELINKNINVVSAKDMYQSSHPNDSFLWKKMVFTKYKNFFNIISIGDAEYEYEALINLYDNNKLLKAIKLLKFPQFDYLIDQINVLNNLIINIVHVHTHMDYSFKIGTTCN